jgi:FkbM family methyltransferase
MVFLDIGAHDGITYSNTYYFEKYKNWNGICIEPIPEVFKKLCENRKSICINACISHYSGKAKFKRIEGLPEMLSYQVDYGNIGHSTRVDRTIKRVGGTILSLEVECISLNDLFQKYQLKKVDYCSLDIEAGELEILKPFNFDLYCIDVLTIENNYYGHYLRDFMKSVGYQLIKSLGCDEVYKKEL